MYSPVLHRLQCSVLSYSRLFHTCWLPIRSRKALMFTTFKEDTNLLNPLKLALQGDMAGVRIIAHCRQPLLGILLHICHTQTPGCYDDYEKNAATQTHGLIHYPPEGKLFTCITVHLKYIYQAAASISSDTKEFHLNGSQGVEIIAPIKQQRYCILKTEHY